MPNVVATLLSSSDTLLKKQKDTVNAPISLLSSIFLIFVISSSTYHLLAMSMLRFHAVKRPLNHMQLTKNYAWKLLSAIWLISLLVAVIPGIYHTYVSL